MKILPADLGLRRNVALLRLRAMTSSSGASGNAGAAGSFLSAPFNTDPHKKPGFFGRMWTSGLGLNDASSAEVMDAIKPMTYGMVGGIGGGLGLSMLSQALVQSLMNHPMGVLLCGTLGVAGAGLGIAMPGILLRKWQHTPVNANEIETLRHSIADSDLEKAYLNLVRDILRSDIPSKIEGELRESLLALGESLDNLPDAPIAITPNDELTQQAADARLAAIDEADPVIAASLIRRAEAQERSAQAAEHSRLVLRRAQALREELTAQTEALRLGIAAYQSGATDTSHLTSLAESVRSVALETTNVARARDEIEAAINSDAGLRRSVETESVQKLRGGG